MSKVKFLPEQKMGLFKIDPRAIEIDPNYNAREDYGDLAELKESIKENGLITPLMVKRHPSKPEKYILVRGHKRTKACLELIDSKEMPPFQVLAQLTPRGWTEIDMIVDLHVSNTGTPLNVLELSKVVSRLLKLNLSEKEIAVKLSKKLPFVMNCILLSEAPESVKDMIKKAKITPTEVLRIFRESNYDEAIERLKNIDEVIPDGSGKKATRKAINSAEGKHNSMQFLRKFIMKSNDRVPRRDNIELYNFSQKLIDGELTKEEIENLLFEPTDEQRQMKIE